MWLCFIGGILPLSAATLYWDSDATANASLGSATGAWNGAATNWSTDTGNTAVGTWGSDIAEFQGNLGAVSTVTAAGVSVNQIIFNYSGTSNYTIAGTLNLTGAAIIDTTNATNSTSVSSTISGVISGTNGITRNGTSNGLESLAIQGNNAGLSGAVFLNGDRTNVSNANALGSGAVTIASGAQMSLNVSLANNITLNGTYAGDSLGSIRLSGTIAGTLTLAGNARIAGTTSGTISGKVTGAGSLEIGHATSTNQGISITMSNATNDWTGGASH